MSIPVELSALAQAMARYSFAYLLTHRAHGAPHAVAVVPRFEDGVLVLDAIGRRTRENLTARPEVGLVWPPSAIAEYSLIVDGTAAFAGDTLRITPSRAVLHRPARRSEPAEPGTCGSDCIELPVPDTTARAQPR